MKSQSQRVPIISPLEKNCDLLKGRDELDATNDLDSSFANLQRKTPDFSQRNAVKLINKFNQKSTNDDLSPESLIHEDGDLLPYEEGVSKPIDHQFTIIDERDIGGANGLDKSELAHLDLSDGKSRNQAQDFDGNQQPLIFYPFPSDPAHK